MVARPWGRICIGIMPSAILTMQGDFDWEETHVWLLEQEAVAVLGWIVTPAFEEPAEVAML